jgi:exopolysaccharide production protein ExoQ
MASHNAHARMSAPINIAQRFAEMEAARCIAPRDPFLNDSLATAYVALSVLILSYASLFSVIPILIYFGLWLPLILTKGFRLLRPSSDMLWALAIPLLCIASTLWSDYPGESLYLGTAFLMFMLCIIIMCRVVRFPPLAQGITIGVAVALLITIISGRYKLDYLSGTYSLIGYFGSKNMVGFTAELGIITALVVFFFKRSALHRLLFAIVPCIICLTAMHMSDSGTSLLSLIAALSVMGLIYILQRLPNQLRAAFIGIGCIVVLTLFAVGITTGGQELLLKGLGKDTTLTGRTELWHLGYIIGWERPVLGHGYSAFWVLGQPQAEKLWTDFFIAPKTGFHFHNVYIQTFVDLGAVGALLIIILVLHACLGSMWVSIRRRDNPEAILLVGLSVMYFVRSWVEVDFFVGPFGVSVLIFYCIGLRVAGLKSLRPVA